jgi:hypothetical protein
MTETTTRLALFGALLATFGEVHPFCDQWVQGSTTARCKRLYGTHPVYYRDGKAVADVPARPGEKTMTASTRGRLAVSSHVASYTAVQTAAALGVTRAFGYRVPPSAMLAGIAVNGITHAVLDAAPRSCGWPARPASAGTSTTAPPLAWPTTARSPRRPTAPARPGSNWTPRCTA